MQATYGIRGQFVFYAGCLLRVKEEAMVKQQTQDQATAWSLFIQLFGLTPPSFIKLPVLKEDLYKPSQRVGLNNIQGAPRLSVATK